MKSLNKFLPLRVSGFALLCSISCGQGLLSAQEFEPLALEVNVPPVQRLMIMETKPFSNIDSEDFNRGYIELKDAVTLSVSSNVPWRVVIFLPRTNLYTTKGKVKPVDSFQWREGNSNYQSISFEPVLVSEGSGCIKDYTFEIDYRLILSWEKTSPGMLDIQPKFLIEPSNSYFSR